MIDLTDNLFLIGFFDSLSPYINDPKKLTGMISELKTCEAIVLLLQTDEACQNFCSISRKETHKIDLETYMNHNFPLSVICQTHRI